MTTAADGAGDAAHIDPDLRADDGEGWMRRFARALVFLFRSVA